MVFTAIETLKDRKGTSARQVTKFVTRKYNLRSSDVKKTIKKEVTKGRVIHTRSRGSDGLLSLSAPSKSVRLLKIDFKKKKPAPPELSSCTFEEPAPPELIRCTFEEPAPPEIIRCTFEEPAPPEVISCTFEEPAPPEIISCTFEMPAPPKVISCTFEEPAPPEVVSCSFKRKPKKVVVKNTYFTRSSSKSATAQKVVRRYRLRNLRTRGTIHD